VNGEIIELADVAAAHLDAVLDAKDAEKFEWSKALPPLQPGEMPLADALAKLCGLAPGTGVTVDEWSELLAVFRLNLPPSRPSRKKPIRPFVWAAIRSKNKKRNGTR